MKIPVVFRSYFSAKTRSGVELSRIGRDPRPRPFNKPVPSCAARREARRPPFPRPMLTVRDLGDPRSWTIVTENWPRYRPAPPRFAILGRRTQQLRVLEIGPVPFFPGSSGDAAGSRPRWMASPKTPKRPDQIGRRRFFYPRPWDPGRVLKIQWPMLAEL